MSEDKTVRVDVKVWLIEGVQQVHREWKGLKPTQIIEILLRQEIGIDMVGEQKKK